MTFQWTGSVGLIRTPRLAVGLKSATEVAMRRRFSLLFVLSGLLGILGGCTEPTGSTSLSDSSIADGGGIASSAGSDDLAQVRAVTARFHRVEEALEAGYELGWVNGSGVRIITGCVAHPTDGAMGYHYFNASLMADNAVDPLEPEVLVYESGADGGLKLVAVEWVVRGPNTNPPGVSDAPSVLGMDMHILVPAVGFWLKHAWIWKHNPAGMFADWNPEVTCP